MGQYLTIGLVTKVSINKERARRKASATPEEVKDALQKAYNQGGIYALGENEDEVYLELKPEVANPEMTDFLEEFYQLRYGENDEGSKKAMDEIRTRQTLSEWLELANGHKLERFRSDSYVWVSTPFCREVWNYSLETRATQIMLSMDGKILMECFGPLFDFFTRMIRERLSKYQLANGLLVSISG